MENHPIPRQITTFEFKLIGFMTVKQFIYLVIFIPLAIIVFYLFPIPILNFIFAAITGFLGIALAFINIQDRPLDVWIINLYKRLTSPTQYLYKKNNPPVYFLTDVPLTTGVYLENYFQSQNYLNQYLQTKNPKIEKEQKKETISQLFNLPLKTKKTPNNQPSQKTTPNKISTKPFLSGIVKNHKLIPIPGVLIYIKNKKGETLRLLKTNPHGVFATFNPLPTDEYIIETKDPKNTYVFDTIKINITDNNKPLEIFSKELI